MRPAMMTFQVTGKCDGSAKDGDRSMAWESSDERNRGQQAATFGTAASLRGVWIRSLVAALLLGCATGCQALRDKSDALKNSSRDMLSWQRKEGEKTADDPSRMVVIWSESVIYGPGKKPTRGLGGRVYFYNRTHQPVKAEGEMTVFAYADQEAAAKGADQGADERAVNADRKYVFTSEEFKNHYSATEFGPSYSIWVPWDAVGGEQQAISLVPVFKTTAGEAIMGDHSRTLLAGKNPKKDAALARRRLREGGSDGIRHGFSDDVAHTKYERETSETDDDQRSGSTRSRRDSSESDERESPTTEAGFADYEGSRQDERSSLRRAMREEEAIETQGERRPAIRTMTIPVPSTMRQRLLEVGEEEAASATQRGDEAENAEEEFDEQEEEVASPRKRSNGRREARRIPSPRQSMAMDEDAEERSWDEEKHDDADEDANDNGPSRQTRASRTTRPQAPLIRREPSPLRAQASRAAQPTADRPRSLPGLAALPLPARPERPTADSPSEDEASDPSVLVSSSSPWSARSVRKQNRPVVVYEPGLVAD
jgi:hypothetical protein